METCNNLNCHLISVIWCLKGIVNSKEKNCHWFLKFQTHMGFFILWNTKWDVSKKVHAALFFTMKVDEGQGSSIIIKKKHYMIYSKSMCLNSFMWETQWNWNCYKKSTAKTFSYSFFSTNIQRILETKDMYLWSKIY